MSWFELPSIVLGKANNAQNIGGAISYIKRYSLCAILGCSSDDDIDCNVPNSNGYTQNNNNNQNNAQSNGQNRQGMPNNQNRPQNGQQNNGGYYQR